MVLTASWTPAIGPVGASSVARPRARRRRRQGAGGLQDVADGAALVDGVEDGLMAGLDDRGAVVGHTADVDERRLGTEPAPNAAPSASFQARSSVE